MSGPGQPGVLCCLPPVPHTHSPHPTPLQPVVAARLPPLLDAVSEAAALQFDTAETQLLLVRSRVGEVCRGVYGGAALPLEDAETPLPVRGCHYSAAIIMLPLRCHFTSAPAFIYMSAHDAIYASVLKTSRPNLHRAQPRATPQSPSLPQTQPFSS